ncbi:MAG: hypothetical protein RR054_01555 [Clostridia bacterium]
MNTIWCIMTAISIILLIVQGQAGSVIGTLIGSGVSAVNFAMKLAALNCVWCGVINLSEDAGAIKWLSKIIDKPIRKLFGDITDKALNLVTVSLAANMAGLSGAATPAAVTAIEEMDKTNKTTSATYAMTMLFVINASGLSIIPTTVIGMRAAAGAAMPADIVLPNLAVTIINTIIGIILVELFYKTKQKKPKQYIKKAINS